MIYLLSNFLKIHLKYNVFHKQNKEYFNFKWQQYLPQHHVLNKKKIYPIQIEYVKSGIHFK